jgi:hypothetical protein
MVRIREGIAEAVVGVFFIGYIAFSVAFLVFDLPLWIYKLWVALLLVVFFLSLILYGMEQSLLRSLGKKAEEIAESAIGVYNRSPSPHGNAKAFITSTKIYPFIKGLPSPDMGEKTTSPVYIRNALDSLPLGDIYWIAYGEAEPVPLNAIMEKYKNLVDETIGENLPETIVSLLSVSIFLLLSMRDTIRSAEKKARPPIGG